MFTLPKLPYSYDALEPVIDARTMEVHHSKHHQTYTDKFNAVIAKYPELGKMSAEDILKNLADIKVDEADRKALRNHGGGYVNHNIFWQVINPNNQPDQKLQEQIKETFGSFAEFRKLFSDTAVNHFGSGWAWLVRDKNGKLNVYSLPNQDSPLSLGHEPILTLDLWEHAYYLKYQNRRAEYVENWWTLVKQLAQ